MIIDAHAHLARNDFSSVAEYMDQLQEAGIDAGVAVPGGMLDVRRITEYIIGRAQPSQEPPDNSYVESAVRASQGRLVGLCCVNPRAEGAVGLLEEHLRRGSRGLKLSPLTHQFSFASRAVAELVACCGDFAVPVYSHTLYNPGASTERFVSLARQFPAVNFILGHMGFGPADQDGLRAAMELDNFFLETSTGNTLHIAEAVRRAGAGKVIFGSEFPLSHPRVELAKVLVLRLPDGPTGQILGGNTRALLRLDDAGGPGK